MARRPPPPAVDPATQAALKEVQAMAASKYFRKLHEFLLFRREALFQTRPTTDRESAMRDGALDELTKLLQAPELLAEFEAAKERHAVKLAEARRTNAAADAPGWMGDVHSGGDLA
jgi:hypothetical protein